MNRVLISDLDGTLLNDDGSVPDSFANFLNLLVKKKILLIFATSRSPQNIQTLFYNYNFEFYSICSDGSSFVRIAPNEIEILNEINLPHSLVCNAIFQLASIGINKIFLFTNHSDSYKIFCLQEEHSNNDVQIDKFLDGRQLIEKTFEFKSILFKSDQISNFVRAISLFDKTEIIENIYEKILPLSLTQELRVYKYPETRMFERVYSWIDIFPKTLSKGMVVNDLKNSMLQDKFIIALGNGVNDKELFLESNLSFCPMNSDIDLMKIASTVVNENSGEQFIKEVSNNILNLAI